MKHMKKTLSLILTAVMLLSVCSCVLFAQALKAHQVPCELHIFAAGDHGILLGMDTPDVSQWPQLAKTFIETHTGTVRTPRENYTHKHQCEATHTYPGPWREDDPRKNALP